MIEEIINLQNINNLNDNAKKLYYDIIKLVNEKKKLKYNINKVLNIIYLSKKTNSFTIDDLYIIEEILKEVK